MKMEVTKKGKKISNIKLSFDNSSNDSFAFEVIKEFAESKSTFCGWNVECKIGESEIDINMNGVAENIHDKIIHTCMMLQTAYTEIQE